ncbi:MAG: BrnT family toxin [Thalassospira sp.]|nr:BrnT family toxin [Thalassospira sp.]
MRRVIHYSWDEAKRTATLAERLLDFRDAWRVYEAPFKVTFKSDRNNEARYLDLAEIEGRLFALVYTEEKRTVRIISFRKARHPKETRIYEQEKNNL